MHRALTRRDQHAFGHHKTQANEIFSRFCELLMEVGQDAKNLLSDNIQAQVTIRSGQYVSRQFRDRRMLADPVSTPRVGQGEMYPDPATAAIIESIFNLFLSYWLGSSINPKTVGPDYAGGGRGIGQIAGLHGNIPSLIRSASGIATCDRMMTIPAVAIPPPPARHR